LDQPIITAGSAFSREGWQSLAVTIKDVAREANVSITTVSAVLRDAPNPIIGEVTRQRVLQVASALNYRHNIYASNLASGKTRLIGLSIFDLSTRVALLKMEAIDRAIYERGYRTLIRNASRREENEARFVDECLGSKAEGVIVIQPSRYMSPETLAPILRVQTPVVTLEPLREDGVDCATVDRTWGGYIATRHLLELGHTRVGLLHLPYDPLTSYGSARVQGYRKALREHGLPEDESLLVVCSPGYESGYQAMQELLSRRAGATGVFCSNDEVAIGAMRAIREAGMTVPEDMSVVGFDDIEVAAFTSVPLTTVAQPVADVAKKAVDMLFDSLEHPSSARQPRFESLKPDLVVRQSSARPRR
jgi:DNA-binding LacI/PurR family transcriptional regulator